MAFGQSFCLLRPFERFIWLLFLKIPEFITEYVDNMWEEITNGGEAFKYCLREELKVIFARKGHLIGKYLILQWSI